MALLTTKGVYGLSAIYEIAKASEISPVTIKEISDNTKISRGYLEQILNLLKNAKIISSVKGKGGGYYLKKTLDEITFYEVFTALEKEVSIANTQVENLSINMLLAKFDLKIKDILDLPLSKIEKVEKESTKYLNFVI
ncbi:RrF2 family transcriptional regulator [Campylobacter corcagiensis]|uniref:Rrf2 family transcriptional regulator n=1 Tax=Campylobacter corcagiensis TaxID=1448857 RepID=A0A7M1LHL5_9BACT|nr:Rrf2 family transcriptional regulator [Campylobacter corcagiensis]QKF64471.1 transcriptional regulator, IscR/Rrf2 family [Campylobacter corcagiensis]QOQ87346.1 Rrf2 family transcriptional regulator [Campylobacter corcagiensis]